MTSVLAGVAPTIFGDGRTSRDFTYVDNAVSANLLAAVAPGVNGLTCNIGCGTRYSLLDLLDAIYAASGQRVEPAFRPERAGDVRHSQADISIARDRLGYEPITSFEDGIARSVAWYRAQALATD